MCPICNEKFGYLHLSDLVKTCSGIEFNCPSCSQKLNNLPLVKIQRKIDFFIYGALSLLLTILAIEWVLEGDSMSIFSISLILTACPACLLLGYLQMKKLDVSEYQIMRKNNDI